MNQQKQFTQVYCLSLNLVRSNRPEVFLGNGVLKKCSKFTGEHPCRNEISIKLLCNFIEITLQHGYSPVNLLYIFRTPFLKNISGWLLLIRHVGFDRFELIHSLRKKILLLCVIQSEKYSEDTSSKPCQTSKMKLYVKIFND